MSILKNIFYLRRTLPPLSTSSQISIRCESTTLTATNLVGDVKLPTNVDKSEIDHHAKIANDWWNPNGTLVALQSMNEIRVPFIRDGLISTKKIQFENQDTIQVLDGINILEVGCGGGLLTEPLARLYANVTGIDLGTDVIAVAKDHLENSSPELKDRIIYSVEAVEEHIKENSNKYDAVVLSEVIEHVTDKARMLKDCVTALKPGGSLFITTPNRTLPMWLGGIVLAENIFNLVPKGTHHYDKFITPIELKRILDPMNCSMILVNGFMYQFWINKWKWIPTLDFCYAFHAVKY